MKPEIKAKWLAALKSGGYKQGHGQLRTNDNKFCCLGVLCDIHASETGEPWIEAETAFYNWKYCGEDLMLPKTVIEWAGLSGSNPVLGDADCGAHNDGVMVCKKSFSEIARLIEEKL